MSRLVVVGAGLAGLRACEAARRTGHDGEVVLLGDEQHLPYDRPPLSKEFLDAVSDAAELDVCLRPAPALEELHIDVRPGVRATGLDPRRRLVRTTVGTVSYDGLVIATGARARTLPGAEGLSGVLALRTLDDARQIRASLATATSVVVVGAGFIGSEVASAARKRGLSVTVVEALPAPLVRSLGAEVGGLCAALHTENGTDLRLGMGVTRLLGADRVEGVELTDGSVIRADLVVAGIGCSPATDWLCGSGVQLSDVDGGVVCDAHLQVLDEANDPVPGVFAAGDVAHWPNPLFERLMRVEHWTTAAEMGAVAAKGALGNPVEYSAVPYFWSDWYGKRLQFVGIPAAEERVVQHRTDDHGGTVVLYRTGQRLTGVLTVGRPDLIMKYRRLVAQRATWAEGVSFGALALV